MGAITLLDVLRCAGCRSGGLRTARAPIGAGGKLADVLECPACLRAYPVQAEVPVMLPDATPLRGPLLDPASARAVLARLGVAADPFATLRVRRASGARVRRGGVAVPQDGRMPGSGAPERLVAGSPACAWLAEFLPRAMQPGAQALASVRLRNTGATAMRYAGAGRVTVSATWRDIDGQPLAAEETRTPLPVDLTPGRALTLAVRLRAPEASGHYRLLLALVREGVAWLEPVLSGPVVRVDAAAAGFVAPPHWVLEGPGAHGLAALRAWLAGRTAPLVAQVGGGAEPAAAALGGTCVNVDGDLLALQYGRVVPRSEAVLPVCADLADLPLAAGRFDAVVSFGALHRTEDPAAVLRAMAALLAAGGFVALCGEPAGHVWPGAEDADLLDSLRRGDTVQRFSLAEWAGLIAAAGLRAVELAATGGLLSARLVREGADG